MKFFQQADYTEYVIICKKIRFTQILFYRGFFKNEKGPGASFQAIFFVEFLVKYFLLQCYIN